MLLKVQRRMIKIISVDTMRKSDANTIKNGTPSTTLMLRASESIFANIPKDKKVAIFCGGGNNGGDGYGLAYLMAKAGQQFDLYQLSDKLTDDAKHYFNEVLVQGQSAKKWDNQDLSTYDVIVDCIFGTGLSRAVEGIYKEVIDSINESNTYVISADIPSGINGDNGLVMGVAVKSNLTVSFGAFKYGHFLNDAKDYVGDVLNYDIGIEILDPISYLCNDKYAKDFFAPKQNNINKGSNGKAVLIGGSAKYMGAPLLSEMGTSALLTGCGLATLVVPKSYHKEMLTRINCSTLYPLDDINGEIIYDLKTFKEATKGAKAIGIGMGMGENPDTIKFIKKAIKICPCVIDADGLNALSKDKNIFTKYDFSNCVLTPHPKEFSRLANISVAKILSNPIKTAEKFAKKNNCTLLLKGTSTVVTNGEKTFIVESGSPAMAKGGSGDVLTGVITGLMARNLSPIDSATVGAYICGKAGEISAREIGEYASLPTNTVDFIPRVVKYLEDMKKLS